MQHSNEPLSSTFNKNRFIIGGQKETLQGSESFVASSLIVQFFCIFPDLCIFLICIKGFVTFCGSFFVGIFIILTWIQSSFYINVNECLNKFLCVWGKIFFAGACVCSFIFDYLMPFSLLHVLLLYHVLN